MDGPCPALGYDKAGKSYCGLIVNPRQFSPIRVAIHGAAALREGAIVLTGAGLGCDALAEGDSRPPGAQAGLLAKANAIPSRAVTKAFMAWGLR